MTYRQLSRLCFGLLAHTTSIWGINYKVGMELDGIERETACIHKWQKMMTSQICMQIINKKVINHKLSIQIKFWLHYDICYKKILKKDHTHYIWKIFLKLFFKNTLKIVVNNYLFVIFTHFFFLCTHLFIFMSNFFV
jgi:hypothetical protein